MRVRDWSSDVCSSDLKPTDPHPDGPGCPFPAASCIMETGRGERAMADSGWGKDIHAGEVGAEFDRGTGRLVHVMMLAIVAFFVAFLAWAAHAPLEVITWGEAEIGPLGQVKEGQHSEIGRTW